ncbi:MAG: LpqB family beta-propeller domain-containing protein [Rothia sp. (in: high G+C Gram-positive bacteria)]|nr:LpqB family beta-propeller domain-containing protein [Rothia sp. (in: high G+C Gram-positive bacteria)]
MNSRYLSRRQLMFLGSSSLLTLAGCGNIPTDGPVNHYADPAQSASASNNLPTATGPQENASAEEIVRGFLSAGVGAANDYEVAREYLTEGFAQEWQPDAGTYVYTQDIGVTQNQSNQKWTVSVQVSTAVDERGQATSYESSTKRTFDFELKQVNGQWRISKAPSATILQRSDFEKVFIPFTLYFYDPTFTYAVPDIRWFADRSTIATSLVRVLFLGPAPYLEGAVATAVPENTQLSKNSVPVDNTVAQVDIQTSTSVKDLTQLQTKRFLTQLTQTLKRLNGIQSVQLSAENQKIDAGNLENYVEAQINAVVETVLVGLKNNDVVVRADISNENNDTVIFQGDSAMYAPAMGYKRQNFAVSNEDRSQISWINNKKSQVVMRDNHFTRPSIDQYQWLWSSSQDANIQVYSVAQNASTKDAQVSASWLEGYTVSSLRISRDGARALIVASLDGQSSVWIAGVQRDADNKPTKLLKPIRLGSTIKVSHAVWYSDASLLVANYDSGESQIVSLSGEITDLGKLSGLSGISAASGANTAVAQAQDSAVYSLVDQVWSRIDVSIQDPSYSG